MSDVLDINYVATRYPSLLFILLLVFLDYLIVFCLKRKTVFLIFLQIFVVESLLPCDDKGHALLKCKVVRLILDIELLEFLMQNVQLLWTN
jgi:hypothetical protein